MYYTYSVLVKSISLFPSLPSSPLSCLLSSLPSSLFPLSRSSLPSPPLIQGALIASALILIQHTEGMNSKSSKIREKYSKMIGDKLEDSVAKYGAIIAQGIIDAGTNPKPVFKSNLYY